MLDLQNRLLIGPTTKKLKKNMQKECRRAFRKYMFNTLYNPYENGKKKRLFRHVKSLHRDYCSPGTLSKDGVNYTDNQMKSELLNEQFSSVFTRHDNSEPPQMENSPYQEISSIDFDIYGIAKLLSELDPTKFSGPDYIPSKLL